MDKMKMETSNLVASNVDKIGTLFPNCVTETKDRNGQLKKGINFDLLRQLLSEDVVKGDEAYEFTWVGKNNAIVEASRTTRKTLRPCPEESLNWDVTENLYIQGDNLEVLKLIQESYLSKIKVIYIDPPYNTGHDFVYPDSYVMDDSEYDEGTRYYDDDGNINYNRENNTSLKRYHSAWCSMIYSRLLLSRNLLTDDGVIFISIDDHEQENMKKMCDEVFGEDNFIAQIVWERAFSPVNLKKHFSESHDYIICYARNLTNASCNGLPRSAEANERYNNPDNDPRGPWTSGDLSVGPRVESRVYEIITPSGRKILPPSGYCWRLDKKTYEAYVKDNRIWFGDGTTVPRIKRFLSDVKQGITPMTIWKHTEVGHSQNATKFLKGLFDGNAYFDYPKPVELIKRCLQLYSDTDCIVLDFFSGSATTAEAVMQLNADDKGKRKFIMVQLEEPCKESSIAYRNGYNTICDIGKDRIKRSGKQILEKVNLTYPNLDRGFRVFKLDESNMNDVYYTADDYNQDLLSSLESNVKSDRTDLDLLFGCLLKWGLPLSFPYKSEQIDGCTIHTYNDGDLIACFDENVPKNVVEAVAKRQPLRAVFRDRSFADSSAKINAAEIFKMLAPATAVKVI